MAQHDLEGNEITSEEIITTKTLHKGGYFCLTVTEQGEAQLLKLKESDLEITSWITSHMRLKDPLPPGKEGKYFQHDLELFKKRLDT